MLEKHTSESINMSGGWVRWVKVIGEINHYWLYLKVTLSDNKKCFNIF